MSSDMSDEQWAKFWKNATLEERERPLPGREVHRLVAADFIEYRPDILDSTEYIEIQNNAREMRALQHSTETRDDNQVSRGNS
jgi:hypothetical protein